MWEFENMRGREKVYDTIHFQRLNAVCHLDWFIYIIYIQVYIFLIWKKFFFVCIKTGSTRDTPPWVAFLVYWRRHATVMGRALCLSCNFYMFLIVPCSQLTIPSSGVHFKLVLTYLDLWWKGLVSQFPIYICNKLGWLGWGLELNCSKIV